MVSGSASGREDISSSASLSTLTMPAIVPQSHLLRELYKLLFRKDFYAQLPGFVEFRTRLLPRHHIVGFFGDATRNTPAKFSYFFFCFVAAHARQATGQHKNLPRQRFCIKVSP